jgi:type 1 fimbriae regulatory protein FimB
VDNSFRKPRRREYLTGDEIDKILVASKASSRNPVRDYCMLLLMFRHGLRVSELCSIKLSDINVDTKEFHVTRLKGCDGGPHELYNGDSGLAGRTIKDESSGRLRYVVYQ